MGGRPWLAILLCHFALSGAWAGSSEPPPEPAPPGLPASIRQQPNIQRLLERASRQDAKAEDSLGDYCYSAKDYTNAVLWYQRAAQHGDANARISLANCYRHGRGITPDPAAADYWAKRALIQEAPDAPEVPSLSAPASSLAASSPSPASPTPWPSPSPMPEPEPEASANAGDESAPKSSPDRLNEERDGLIEAWFEALEKPMACSRRVHALRRPQPELLEISTPGRSSKLPQPSPEL